MSDETEKAKLKAIDEQMDRLLETAKTESSFAATHGSVYRLLHRRDTILWDDEYLDDDCTTWRRVGNQAGCGQPYDPSFHQPMRRVNTPNIVIERQ